jgi:hypothetical protein
MSKSGTIKDMIRAARPGTVIIMTLQDFKEIVQEVAGLLRPLVSVENKLPDNTFVQNIEQSKPKKEDSQTYSIRESLTKLEKLIDKKLEGTSDGK